MITPDAPGHSVPVSADPVSLLVVGPVTRDVTLSVRALPADGASAIAEEIRVAAGGKGGNPAVTAARLGASVRLLGAVGSDHAGELALAQLREDGIDVGSVARLQGEVTGQIVHLVEPDGHRRYVEWRGANEAVAFSPDQVRSACRERPTVLLSTALPSAAVRCVADGARAMGATIVADLSGDPETAAGILDRVDVARGDADEIAELVDAPVRGFASATAAAQSLLARGPSTVIVQAGEQGNVVLTAERELHVSEAPVEPVDPTGGGDAFIAAFAVLRGRGESLATAARLAAAAAGHVVSRLGGRPAFRDEGELRGLASRCRVEELPASGGERHAGDSPSCQRSRSGGRGGCRPSA